VDDDGAVVDAVQAHQRGADNDDAADGRRLRHQPVKGVERGGQDGVLHQQVFDRVAGEGQFGEDGKAGAGVGAFVCLGQDGLGVGHRLHHPDSERAGGHAGEPMAVEVVEVHSAPLAAVSPQHATLQPPIGETLDP